MEDESPTNESNHPAPISNAWPLIDNEDKVEKETTNCLLNKQMIGPPLLHTVLVFLHAIGNLVIVELCLPIDF